MGSDFSFYKKSHNRCSLIYIYAEIKIVLYIICRDYKMQSTHRGRVEMGGGGISALSAGAYTTT